MNFTRKLIGLGAAITFSVLAVSLWTEIVWAQEQIAIYRVLPAQVTREAVLKLAREAFGMESPQVTEDDVAFMLQQEQKRLTMWKASGAILFADDSKLWNPSYRPSLPSLEEATRLGEEFIRKNNLVPSSGELRWWYSQIRYAAREDGQGKQEFENHWELFYTLFHIDTGEEKEGTPILVRAGALTLELGDRGEVIGLQRELGQELGPKELKPKLSSDQVRAWFQWKVGSEIQFSSPSCSFGFQGAYNSGYNFFLPGCIAWAPDREREHLWHHVPETSFAVLARIVEPKDKAKLPAGIPIGFRAEVASGFGAAPYQYVWYSNRDGLLGQASTFRKALSPGQHAITLWVSDRNGTSDAHTIIIQVGGSMNATGWPLGLMGGLALLGLLLGLSGARRSGLTLILSGVLVFGSFPKATDDPSKLGAAFPAQVLQQPLRGGQYNFWPDQGKGKLQLTVSFADDNGMELDGVSWTPNGRNSIRFLSKFSIPYIEIKPKGGVAIKLEIPNPPKFSRLSKLANPICDPQRSQLPGLWGVTDVGRQLEAHYDLEVKDAQGQRLGSVNLVFDFRFYHPNWCRNSRAPEFYPEVRYTVQGFQVEKVRVPFRFDVDAPDITGEEPIDGQNDVAMMVREPLTDVIYFGLGETRVGCVFGQLVIRALPQGGELWCVPQEFMQENFDNYHQADKSIIAPSCETGRPCFHFHMLKPALGQKFLAVRWNPGESQPQKIGKEPEGLINTPPENLKDIVFWYIAESDKPQDSFAADRLMWPAQFVGFSCDIKGKTFGYPACE
jgi:hypothetical protein